MGKILVVLADYSSCLEEQLLSFVLFFTFAAFRRRQLILATAALPDTMAPADSESEMLEESLAAAEAPDCASAQPRVAARPTRAPRPRRCQTQVLERDARVIRNGF